ncbi:MAG: hypothetical protein RBT45_08040, partial [Acholeplasmataceae bacterium]|nr:hypothetical protein [Acholeplasmataceae bacterium]
GKTELAKILYKSYGYTKCVTTTTRNPRVNEINGIDYHFVSHQEFYQLEKSEAFLEVTRYQDNFYGIQRKDVKINGVVIVDPNGANAIVNKIGKDAFIVYVHSSEPLREKRMMERKDELVLITKRLENDCHIFNEEAFTVINLILENEHNDLNDLANHVHESYQHYLSKIN